MNQSLNQSFMNRIMIVTEKIEDNFIVKVVRNGLMTMIPFLMIGAFALVLQSFPLSAYQYFIEHFAGGFLYDLFHMVYIATFGFMSLYMTLSFSVTFFTLRLPNEPVNLWGVGSTMASFMIMVGAWSDDFSISDLGATSVFLAIATSIISSYIYFALSDQYIKITSRYSYSADSRLSKIISNILPAAVTILIAALVSFLITMTGYSTAHKAVIGIFVSFFELIDNLFWKGFLFIFISSFLWLVGIHGSDCLQGVSDQVFTPLMDANVLASVTGGQAKEVLCKPFFDCYILMGGCGSCICLFLAILIFSKNKSMRTIAKAAGFPIMFNISELMVFGLPIVFNPVLAIPFLLVPCLQYFIAYGATITGLVPCISTNVEWTTPVLISGFVATGSIRGLLLQLVNIAVGVLIYAPFVQLMGKVKVAREESSREEFVKWYIANEAEASKGDLLALRGLYGDIAKRMALELKDAIAKDEFSLYYQPQYNYEGKCIGVESLLRMPKNDWLSVYPPLLVQLAKEQDILLDMEKRILNRAISQRNDVFNQFGRGIKISVNVTGNSVAKQDYWQYLKEQWQTNGFEEGTLCIEVTEQEAIVFDDVILSEFRECKKLGIKFAIDDFSAGQTSIEYLKNGIFDLLKLDGSLVKTILENPRCSEIISSLVILSDSLHIDCLAEYVENEAIKEKLHETGCNLYQGYLYSPAIPLDVEK